MIPVNLAFDNLQGTPVPASKQSRRHPDAHLLTRTSWTDARTALSQITKGKASGNKAALWLRAKLQGHLFNLGCFIQANAGKVLFVGLLVLSTFCVGLKSATMQTDVEKLWVEEGGRLEKELKYIRETLGEGSGSTNQILIQTPKEAGANVLQVESLLIHLEAVRAAISVTVDMFDVTWKLKDLCYSPSIPSFDAHYIDSILENLFPCAIITPLDCFWEGSKLLGPEIPVAIPGLHMGVQWTTLNPQWLVNTVKNFTPYATSFPYKTLVGFMKRAGITTAYQEKPCLDPTDEQCPTTSPNKKSGKLPSIGTELTGGCYGFATKYMHWPEDLIVGGVVKSRSGHIVRAEALQTVVQLMAEKEMYELWNDNFRVHNLDWTIEKARMILEAWQRKFTKEVEKQSRQLNLTRHNTISSFSTTSLMDIMKEFSEISVTKVVLGYVLMLIYACVSLLKWSDAIRSQSGIGIAGVLLVAVTVAAGLGFCALMGIVFNASTTQIVPFLALGLGVDDMFLLAHTYAENANSSIPLEEQTGECLKRTGISILLTSASNICAFFSAAIIPVPALRAFVLQSAILVSFNVATMLLLFPAVVSLDLRRREAKRIDIFCCFLGANQVMPMSTMEIRSPSISILIDEVPKRQSIARALPPDRSHVVTILAPSQVPRCESEKWAEPKSAAPSVENLTTANSASTKELISPKVTLRQRCLKTYVQTQQQCQAWSLTRFAMLLYAPFLQKTSIKVITVLVFIVVLVASIWGVVQVDDGLDLMNIVPRHTSEYQFLSAQSKYFGFFNMFAVTQGNFEYPNNQKLLYEYHDAFTRIGKIIKNDDGGLPEFWLLMFRDWLLGLQKAFDKDWKNGCITQERWFSNASDDGILAYKLLVQTGRVDHPIDKTLVTVVRLVDEDNVINPKAFYNYLTAWVSNDALAYSASQANLRPDPREWIHDPKDVELKIPKSQPLTYAQMPFYLNKMSTTQEITETIQEVRAICDKFKERGLPNFPTGIPFIYWEQYIKLRLYLFLALVCVLTVIFLVFCVVLVNLWAAVVVVVILAFMVLQLFGLIGILGIRLSAVPAVILIVAVGIGVEFTAHIVIGFLTSIGNRNRRMAMTLEHMFAPVMHGALSTLIGVLMLAFSEFDFIIRYFFYVLFALVLIGLLNGLLLLPVVLSLVGPPGEVIPKDDPNRIPTPSPPPSPPKPRVRRESRSGSFRSREENRFFGRRFYPRVNSDISLSTITEEPQSYHSSHEIVVHPEVVVETTTITNTTTKANTNTSCVHTNIPGTTESRSTTSTPSDKSGNDSDASANTTTTSTTTTTTNTATGGLNQPSTQTEVTTKVTATAKVKVAVHAPLSGPLEREHSYRHTRRRRESPSNLPDVDSCT